MSSVVLIDDEASIADAAARLARARLVPIDVESNGLHAYSARLCVLQAGLVDEATGNLSVVYVVDPITAGDAALGPLSAVLGPTGPQKLVHDLAFDARILAKHGVMLGNVYDTAVTARFLGLPGTSLAALALARLGVNLSKELQHHDWGARPLGTELFPYLEADVAHLPALARSLAADAEAKGIAEEIAVETEHRLQAALAARDDDPRPPYVRIKGSQLLDPVSLAVLRRLADLRERLARQHDRPPFKILGNETLLELARLRSPGVAELSRVRGISRSFGDRVRGEILAAIGDGLRDADIPAADRATFFSPSPRPPRGLVEARRGREQRLTAFRRAEAKRREVDEQVVLPGHCLQQIADDAPGTIAELRSVGGFGEGRVARYGEEILRVVAGVAAPVQ